MPFNRINSTGNKNKMDMAIMIVISLAVKVVLMMLHQ